MLFSTHAEDEAALARILGSRVQVVTKLSCEPEPFALVGIMASGAFILLSWLFDRSSKRDAASSASRMRE